MEAERNARSRRDWRALPAPSLFAARWKRLKIVVVLVALCGGLAPDPALVRADEPAARPESAVAAAVGGGESLVDDLQLRGASVWRWREGTAEAFLLEGACELTVAQPAEAAAVASSDPPLAKGWRLTADAVLLLVERAGPHWRATLYADEELRIDGVERSSPWSAAWTLTRYPAIEAPHYRGKPTEIPALAQRFRRRAQATLPEETSPEQTSPGETSPGETLPGETIRPVQYELPAPAPYRAQQAPPADALPGGSAAPPLSPGDPPGTLAPAPGAFPEPQPAPAGPNPNRAGVLGEQGIQFSLGGGSRAVEILPRSTVVPPQTSTQNRPETGETVVISRGGVTVRVRDLAVEDPLGRNFDLGTLTLSADRVVAWLPEISGLFSGATPRGEVEGELYLEGDIVFRQGDRVIYADRMYYNITRQYGMILSAEAISPIPENQGVVRLKAEVMQQVAEGEFVAFDAAVTTSRLGVPRYWLQSEQLRFSRRQEMVVDPATGLGAVKPTNYASSTNNFVYIGGFPVLYWPVFSGNFERSSFYITDIQVKNDNIFGTQAFVDFDLFQLFGVETPPDGVDWTLSTDYLSERGPALGTNLDYNVPGLLGVPGPVTGTFDLWAIDDDGLDFLGQGRQNLQPEETLRGRLLARHRHYLPNDFEFILETGLISDRNFLEQYLESEWDHTKDQDTSVRLRKYYLNNLFDLRADVRVNDFFTETNQLPRLDHYGLGGSIFGDRATWSMHNQVGYANLEVAEPPIDPAQAATFTLLPGEAEREGLVAATRQEVSVPLEAGPLKVAPFVSGEVAYFGEDAAGDQRTRLLGQAGVRGTLPMWRLYPTVQSSLLNIRGLAHKLEWEGEFFYADSDTDLDDLPLYDPLDDDAQEQFRRRFSFNNFGGPPLPARFDPRTYALRQGLQRYVTSPSTPIADDLMQARLGLNQRWQTKRGLRGRERIVDLARFDVDMLLFPKEDRDNFGETLGPATYDFRYHVGDRVTLLSDGYLDFFSEGLRSVSAGVLTSRPGLGDLYVGFLSLEGPISSNVLRSSVDYRLNEKWIMGAGTTFDFGKIGNVGQSFSLTRIGESALLRMGISVDSGRDNVSFVFGFEPRFWPQRRLGRLGGQMLPPPGAAGLE